MSAAPKQQLQQQQPSSPFSNDPTDQDEHSSRGSPIPSEARPSSKLGRAASSVSGTGITSSFSQRTPARSFNHYAPHGPLEPTSYSSQGVRDQTAELASWALSDPNTLRTGASEYRRPSISDPRGSETWFGRSSRSSFSEGPSDPMDPLSLARHDTIQEVSEPVSPAQNSSPSQTPPQSSALTEMLRNSPPQKYSDEQQPQSSPEVVVEDADAQDANERTRLLGHGHTNGNHPMQYSSKNDLEGQVAVKRRRLDRLHKLLPDAKRHGMSAFRTATNPKLWTPHSLWHEAILPTVQTIPSVILGLLLNILDALSYGFILFPLGTGIFSETGPDGIAIFYVSCIVSQLVYSCGGSIFKGGVGSEMIEVVPFFHKMAYMIMATMGTSNPDAVRATVISSYALSSIFTGIVFYALGAFKLGTLVNFFPRSILTGCIGGVGLFLVLTGVEVSARLDGNLDASRETLEKLFSGDTIILWILPLLLAIILLIIRYLKDHPAIVLGYFFGITVLFYIVVAAVPSLTVMTMRQTGWIFQAPASGVPFYHFYSYYKWNLIDWKAISQTIPTMFALTLFGILHVPINVPALGVAVKEDDVNINRELRAHGWSNALSGCLGSIQNYLVYTNSVLFINTGGDSRIAGCLLALATCGVWMAGPEIIGFIPVMIVGTLIYMLGIELVIEALWDTRTKVQRLEYCIILAIVLIMGFYDFVAGIFAGVALACLNYVVQTSRKSAIRANFSGAVAESTVRRHPIQRRYLHEVGRQTSVVKLAGYLFFGTIVEVENKTRALIEEEAFRKRPIRYLVLDFTHVTGLDFSAAEAFTRMNRILHRRNVEMILSGVVLGDDIEKSLKMVGILNESADEDAAPPPKVFEDLNKALESCENELLITFKQRTDMLAQKQAVHNQSVAVPQPASSSASSTTSLHPTDSIVYSSPRRTHLEQAATSTLNEPNVLPPSKWSHFQQPLPLILQTFQDLTEHNEDFWYRAVPFFTRKELPAGTLLYSRGDEPDGFYLLQEGILRADYDWEQGRYSESIVAGTACGELPFFAETDRSATVAAEKDCVAWLLTRARWRELEEKQPEVARELLKIGLKLTSERMAAITSYVLVAAG
ncbi:MAG: hypothetical protein Q9165_004511 [Trypethelium subeluteriae]